MWDGYPVKSCKVTKKGMIIRDICKCYFAHVLFEFLIFFVHTPNLHAEPPHTVNFESLTSHLCTW